MGVRRVSQQPGALGAQLGQARQRLFVVALVVVVAARDVGLEDRLTQSPVGRVLEERHGARLGEGERPAAHVAAALGLLGGRSGDARW